jgi:hypothetical protein
MADKYSLQFQLGTTLDKKGLEELKKQLDQIGLKSVNIGTNFTKLTKAQLKAFKDTTKASEKRLTIEEGYLSLQKKQYRATEKQRVSDKTIASDKRRNNGETIASLKKVNELKIKAERLDQRGRRNTQREREIDLKSRSQRNEASLGYTNARTGILLSRQGQIISKTQGQNLKNIYAPDIYRANISKSISQTRLFNSKALGQETANSFIAGTKQAGIDLTNARTDNINSRTEGVNIANSFIAGTKQAIINKINTATNLIGEKVLSQKIKNAFSPYVNFLNLQDKQAKINLTNEKIQDIKDKKIDREKQAFRKENDRIKREAERAIRKAEKDKLQNFLNTKNKLYGKANLLENVANPVFYGATLPSAYYLTTSVTQSASNRVSRESQMKLLFGEQTPEMLRFAKQYAKDTPIGVEDASALLSRIKGSQEALGITDDEVKSFAKGLGDFALVFGRGKMGMGTIIYQLTQIADTGKPDYRQDIRPIFNAGGGVVLEKAFRKRYGMSLATASQNGDLDRQGIFQALKDVISDPKFQSKIEERKKELPGQLDQLTTSLQLFKESVGMVVDKMFGIGDKASKLSDIFDEFGKKLDEKKGGGAGGIAIAGLLGLGLGGIGLLGYSKYARAKANYFASKGPDYKGGNGKFLSSAFFSTPSKILGVATAAGMIYGGKDAIGSAFDKAKEGYKQYAGESKISGGLKFGKEFFGEMGIGNSVVLTAGIAQLVSLGKELPVIKQVIDQLAKLPLIFTGIGASLVKSGLGRLGLFGRLGLIGAVGFGAYEVGKFLGDAYSDFADSEEIKATKDTNRFMESLRGKTSQQQYDYLKNLKVETLNSTEKENRDLFLKSYEGKAISFPTVQKGDVSKNSNDKTAYKKRVIVQNPTFATMGDS